ncbi:MAG: tyrosine-type recombinase/integrase [Pirellulaceae bacterium]
MARTSQAPSYDLYKGKFARVIIDRKSIHLGKYGSDESHQKYRQLIATWSTGQQLEIGPSPECTTVAVLLEAYRTYAAGYFGDVHGGRYRNLLPTIRMTRELYADLPAHQFSPKKLKTLRQAFVNAGHTRGHCNTCVQRVIAMFRWAAEEELVGGSLVHALEAIRPLQRGHTSAPEGRVVHAVDQEVVNVTLLHLTTVLADMVCLQLVAGCRPGELCSLTPDQLDRTGDVWLYRPAHHKTIHHGHDRVIAIGPRGQDILRKYLLRAPDAPCFSPKESLTQFYDQTHERRTTPMSCGNRPSSTRRARAVAKVANRYTVGAYRRAIERACDRAFPAPEELDGKARRKWQHDHRWTPHRLRHTAGGNVREKYGLDGAQAILGHKNARVTEVYSELNTAKAVEIARKLG